MYNDRMPEVAFEIRICDSCGLRYPLEAGHRFGRRCPVCLGATHLVLSRQHSIQAAPPASTTTPAKTGMAVLLDNIRSAWNVGSILRSADGFGFRHAYVCGITPTPDHEAVTKTSLGAEESVPWSYHKDAVRLVQGLKKEGVTILALEEHAQAAEIRHADKGIHPSVLILGNEISGVDPGLLDLCDRIFHIPMRGEKRSFNVAIAFGIAAYALSRE